MFLKKWFSHSKKERRGIITLIIILLVLITFSLFMPEQEFSKEDISQLMLELDDFYENMDQKEIRTFDSVPLSKRFQKVKHKDTVFFFNPNTIDSLTFLQLGFTSKQVKSILLYRNKGGKFYKNEDFKNLYVVSEQKYIKLEPYIQIPERLPKRYDEKQTKNSDLKDQIDLNRADTTVLKQLKGIGGYYASKIIAYRISLGGFINKEQLMEIHGIDSTRYHLFVDNIIVDTAYIRKIHINTVDDYQLSKHPYVGKYLAKGIINFRNFKKEIQSVDELVHAKVLNQDKANKLRPYISF